MRNPLYFLSLAALVACGDDTKSTDTDTGAVTDDTASDTSVVDTSVPCEVTVGNASIAEGDMNVYYRDTLTLSFSGDAVAAGAVVAIRDASGADASAALIWSEGNVQASFALTLAPSTPYTLHAEVCGVTTDIPFTTSSLGEPLTGAAEDLVGHTYVFRLSDSEITDPRFLDALAGTYLTVPLLITVTMADASSIDLLGALGELRDDGTYRQLRGEPTWDFPVADFSAAPYFSASAERIVIPYAGIEIPVEDFTLSGTFTSDGTELAEAIVTGLGDSRDMGALLGQADDPNAMCSLAAAAGVECEPCGDGEPYCLHIVAEEINAQYLPGVSITAVP